MRKTFQLMIAAGALGLPLVATAAGPDHDAKPTKQPEDVAQSDLAKMIGFEFKAPDLFIGDKAPKLEIAQFVKGESVDGFEPGQVYVVEFWATWCGPCVAAFPHLSELQKEYGDKVRFIGVNIWDRKLDRATKEFTEGQGDWVKRVSDFVDTQGDRMSYTVALEQDTKMADNWMTAGGRNGIPSAFVVDGTGKIAWVGHPMDIEESLKKAVDGHPDYEGAIAAAKAEELQNAAFSAFITGMRSDDEAEAAKGYKIGRAVVDQYGDDNAQMYNSIAWNVINPDAPVPHRDYQFALDMAHKGAELTKFEDPMILDTYALALFKTGDVKGAVAQEQKALGLTDNEDYKKEFQSRLDEFQGKAKDKKSDG